MPRDLGPLIGDRAASAAKVGWGGWLLTHAWRGVVAASIFVGLCVVFGEDAPAPESAGGGKISLRGDFGLVGALNFAADGETLLSTSWDKTARVWNLDAAAAGSGAEVARLASLGELFDVAMSPDDQTVVVAGAAGVAFWNWRDERSAPQFMTEPGPSRSLAISADGRRVFVGGLDGKIRLLDMGSRRILATFGEAGDVIRGLWIASDDAVLIALGYSGKLTFWDWRSERPIDKIKGSTNTVLAVALSPDGETLALSRYWRRPGEVEVWDLRTGRLKARCQGHEGVTHALAFSRDGGMLASAGGDMRIRFGSVATGRGVGGIDNTGGWVRVLRFSGDGRWLVYSGEWDRVRLKRIEPPGLAARSFPSTETPHDA